MSDRHYHVANYVDGRLLDECAQCGLDFRDPIHWRSDEIPVLTPSTAKCVRLTAPEFLAAQGEADPVPICPETNAPAACGEQPCSVGCMYAVPAQQEAHEAEAADRRAEDNK